MTVAHPFRILTLSGQIEMADVHSAMVAAASPSSCPIARTVGVIGSVCVNAGRRGTTPGVEMTATLDLAKKGSTTLRRWVVQRLTSAFQWVTMSAIRLLSLSDTLLSCF